MIAEIHAPYVDTSPAELQLTLSAALLPAVRTTLVPGTPISLELRLLRASHQVIARWADGELIETLACLGDDPQLPGHVESEVGTGRYRVRTRVDRFAPERFATTAADLVRAHADDDRALIGRYPGHALAVTGIYDVRLTAEHAQWRTWHSYPQTGEIVHTDSTVSVSVRSTMLGGVPA